MVVRDHDSKEQPKSTQGPHVRAPSVPSACSLLVFALMLLDSRTASR